jgi:hypothetical protein
MRDWRTPPTGVIVWRYLEALLASSGMVARSHGAAVQKGELMQGQTDLPW